MQSFSLLASAEAKHTLISKILKSLKHYPSTILSLGADENDGLGLFEKHNLVGVVTDKTTLGATRERLSTAKFYAHSLVGYRIPQKVQLTYLLDQKINTIIGEKNRQKFFQKVLQHLEPYGVGIFDLYLGNYFEHKKKNATHISVTENEVYVSSWKEKKGVYLGSETRLIKEEHADLYSRRDYTQSYQTFSLPHLKKMLKVFDSVQILDSKGRKLHKKSDHVVVVVRKGWE